MFIRAEQTGNFELHISSSVQMKCCRILLLLAMANIQSQFENIFKILRICVLAWKRNIKKVLSPSAEMITFSGEVVSLTRSLNKH